MRPIALSLLACAAVLAGCGRAERASSSSVDGAPPRTAASPARTARPFAAPAVAAAPARARSASVVARGEPRPAPGGAATTTASFVTIAPRPASSPAAGAATDSTLLALVSPSVRSPLAAGPDDPSRGRDDAPVTAIVFGDVECPFTAKAVGSLEALQERVGRERLRIVWKNYPLGFHRRARPAAEAAAAVAMLAGGERAYSVLESALEGATDDVSLEEAARSAGAPMETYRFVLSEARGEVSAKVDADIEAAEALGVRGVPHVVLGAREIRGAASVGEYASAFDEAAFAAPR